MRFFVRILKCYQTGFSLIQQRNSELAVKAVEDRDNLRKELATALARVKALEDQSDRTDDVGVTDLQMVETLGKLDANVQVVWE